MIQHVFGSISFNRQCVCFPFLLKVCICEILNTDLFNHKINQTVALNILEAYLEKKEQWLLCQTGGRNALNKRLISLKYTENISAGENERQRQEK